MVSHRDITLSHLRALIFEAKKPASKRVKSITRSSEGWFPRGAGGLGSLGNSKAIPLPRPPYRRLLITTMMERLIQPSPLFAQGGNESCAMRRLGKDFCYTLQKKIKYKFYLIQFY